MDEYCNIDGQYRKIVSIHANIDGEWRDVMSISPNIDGKYSPEIAMGFEEKNIIAFRVVYVSDPKIVHPAFPHLKFNPNLPATLRRTGINPGVLDLEPKGVILEFTNENEPDQLHDEEEGIMYYYAKIYAIMDRGTVIDSSNFTDDDICMTRHEVNGIPGMNECWSARPLNQLDISIDANVNYSVTGLHTEGFNRFLSTMNCIGNLSVDHTFDGKLYPMRDYHIFPSSERSKDFDNVAQIGIVRDLHTAGQHMVGSSGYFEQAIARISVNGVPKPFTVEVYDL